ncbi:TipJ family phage tail tip protein [Azospirillum canadense]|uniref:TipJ family phage tail tip protein n=1 Tax=Azospirillum canadense TaxID=403962 RepID=UPI002226C24E|nr:phage tail protein [Azospirillum canadense]MCW2242812.1 putative phage tail protein [Azospirillum canadense]MCW2243570.1 putative phage tail protein [Azospirillum canadense]
MALRKVHLHGALRRRFGAVYELDVASPAEAFRALHVLTSGAFLPAVKDGTYRIIRGDKKTGLHLGADELTFHLGAGDLHIAPVAAGSGQKSKGGVKAVIGMVIMAVAIVYSGGTAAGLAAPAFGGAAMGMSYGSIALFGLSMVLSGASMMLAPQVKGLDSLESVDKRASFVMNGPVNAQEQGGAVPLIYGRCRVGSTVVSAGLSVDQISTGATVDYGTAGESGGVSGSGGGKGGGGGDGGRVAQEDPNTLQSTTVARVIDLLGEGEIDGLVDGARSITLDGTPLITGDGSANFPGVTWTLRTGLPDQPHVEGFTATENEVAVSTEVKHDVPVVRTITNPNADAVRVTIRIPALTRQDVTNGDLHGAEVDIAIEVKPTGGVYRRVVHTSIAGKTTSPYERSFRIELPKDGTYSAPWDVRVVRINGDSTSTALQDATWWQSYTVLTDGKFSYPNSAYVALEVDAKLFGSSIPARAYEVRGLRIQVPSNYDPATRTYVGAWNGLFKVVWSDNPAWVLYDLLTSKRYGLGKFINASQVDKWSLYQIAQYCDQLVPDGQGGWEPRFTFNGVIASREDAYKVIQGIASSFRGLVYWSSGQIYARADMPGDPVKLVAPANVINGAFSYSGTAVKARHSSVLVTYTNPDDGDRAAIEVVENPTLIERYGWRQTEITAYGCRSRSQARRLGRWLLETEQRETETVTYEAAWDHADVMPGDLVAIADPNYAGVRFGGRVAAATTSTVTLDAPVTLEAGQSYALSVVLADGSVVERDVVTGVGSVATIAVAGGFPSAPEPGAMWVLTGSNLAPRLFRVLAVREKSKAVYEVTALSHDPGKYARVEDGLDIPPPVYQNNGNGIPAPTNLTAVESVYWINGLPQARMTVAWSPVPDPVVAKYRLAVQTPGGQWQVHETALHSLDLDGLQEGLYTLRLRSVAVDGRESDPAVEAAVRVHGKGIPPGQPTGLAAIGGYRQITLTWVNPSDTDLAEIEVWENDRDDLATAVLAGTVKGNTFPRGGLGGLVTKWFWVRAVDLGRNPGDFNSNLGTSATTQQISHEDLVDRVIAESKLVPLLAEKIDSVEKVAETLALAAVRADSTFARVKAEIGKREADVAEVTTKITQEVTDRQALAEQVTTVTAQFDGQFAQVTEKLTTLANADEATATRIDGIVADVDERIAGIVTTQEAHADGISANAKAVTDLAADVNGKLATVNRTLTTQANDIAATAGSVTALSATVGQNTAAIASEATTRSSADQALSTRFDQMAVTVGQNTAAITAEQTTRATAVLAVASDVQTLSSTVGQNTAAIQTAASSIDGLQAQWTVKVDVNGYAAGFGLAAYDRGEAGKLSEFVVRAGNFIVGQPGQSADFPFVIGTVDGVQRISMSTAFIQDASINSAKIANAAIKSAHIGYAEIDDANIKNLTIQGRSIADLATGNMAWGAGGNNASCTMTTTGKPIAVFACSTDGFFNYASVRVVGRAAGTNTFTSVSDAAIAQSGFHFIVEIELRK